MDQRTEQEPPSPLPSPPPPAPGGLPPLVWIPAVILFAAGLVLLFV